MTRCLYVLIIDQRHNNSLSQVHKTFFVSALTTEQINAWSKKGKCWQRLKNASHNSNLKCFHAYFENCRFQVFKTKEKTIN